MRRTRSEAGVALLALGLIFGFARLHVDDVDASLYHLIARNLVHDGDLFHLTGLSIRFEHFTEHPPFYFWFLAAVIRVLGEGAVPWIAGLFGAGTLVLTYLLGSRLGNRRTGVAAAFLLATCESFFRYQARARLDGPLTFFFTASVFAIIWHRERTAGWIAGGLLAGFGALVKGPPALGAPVAAVLFLAIRGDVPPLRRTLVALLFAGLLPALFLLYDQLAFDGYWWRGYVQGQLLGSALGVRTDGHTQPFYLLRSLSTRFWPGLPFVLIALFRIRDRTRLGLLAWGLFIPLGFELAARAYWHYNMPALVPLSILGGFGLCDLADRWPRLRSPIVGNVLLAAGAVVAVVMLAGLGAPLQRPCPLGPIPDAVRTRSDPDTPVGMVLPPGAYGQPIFLGKDSGRDVVGTGTAALSLVVVHRSRWPIPGRAEVLSHGDWILSAPSVPE